MAVGREQRSVRATIVRLVPFVALFGNLASVFAMAIAFYAIVNPGAVSDYLDDIAESSEKSPRGGAYGRDLLPGGSAVDPAAGAVGPPYWLETERIERTGTTYAIDLKNRSADAFDEVRVWLVSAQGAPIWTSREIVLPPHEGVSLRAGPVAGDADAAVYCVTGYSRAAKETFHEARGLYPPDGDRVGLQVRSWELAREPLDPCIPR